jgi:GT2 family glycosyltransferase
MTDPGTSFTPMTVSVVIPTFNRLESLKMVLEALFNQSHPQDAIEIIVVDNSSTDGTKEWVEGLPSQGHENVRVLRKQPEGPPAARNTGLYAARGKYTLFLDSDVELDRKWISNAVDAIAGDPKLGAVGGIVTYAHDPSLTNAFGGVLSVLGYGWDFGEGRPRNALQSPRQCIWVNCSALMTRTGLVREIGGFDEEFFYGYEDSDLGWRVYLAGYRIDVLPSLHAVHHIDPSVGQSDPKIVFHYTKNRLRSVLKNYNARHAIVYGALCAAVTFADAIVRPPRSPKWHALTWNLQHLPATLRARRKVQGTRVVADRELRPLFEARWFPQNRLDGMRRRSANAESAPRSLELGRDDRVH